MTKTDVTGMFNTLDEREKAEIRHDDEAPAKDVTGLFNKPKDKNDIWAKSE